MSTLRIVDGDDRRTVPLASSTLVGRAWACHARISHLAAPLYWLEIRWLSGAWAWRALAADARTRGGGPFLSSGWRALTPAGGRAPRVSLGPDLWVELRDSGPPLPFLADAESGAPVEPEAVDHAVELRADAVFALGSDGLPGEPLADGAIVVVDGRALRVHVPVVEADTLGARVDLGAHDLVVDIDVEAQVARFSQGHAEVSARGACVRLLAAYLAARAANVPNGGWLTPDEAHAGWVALGGPADASPARVAWERAKLRAQLSRAGATQVDALYEVRRDGETVRTRVRGL